jgi:hypothetical protein
MILYLLMRDDIAKVALVSGLLAPLVLMPGWSPAFGLLQAIAMMGLFTGVKLRLDRRTTGFQITLPIAGREILLVRMIGAILTIWLPVGAASLLLTWVHRDGSQSLCLGGAALTLAALLPLTVRLREATIPGWISFGMWVSAVALGVGVWFILPPEGFLALFAALICGLMVHAAVTVPATFEVAPREASAVRPAGSRLRFQRPDWWPIARSAMPWLAVPFFAWGLVMSGNLVILLEAVIFAFQAGVLCRDRSRWLHTLPLSRHVLLGLTMVTTVGALAAGAAFGDWIYRPAFLPPMKPFLGRYRPGIDQGDRFLVRTNVPLEYWRKMPGAAAPIIIAPWGESVKAATVSIFGLNFYNPYTATKANSPQFFDWQVGNATQTMYGERMSSDESAHYAHRQIPRYPGQNRLDILGFSTLVFFLLTSVYVRELSLSRSLWRFRSTRFLSLAVALLFAAWFPFDFGVLSARYGTPVSGPLLQILFTQISAAVPGNSMMLLALAMAPSLAMYWLALRQFAQAETAGPILPKMLPD